jgi:hypothetical protein
MKYPTILPAHVSSMKFNTLWHGALEDVSVHRS